MTNQNTDKTSRQVVAILQARMSSSRLSGKVLKPILDQPMLALQIQRVLNSKKIDKLVIATSEHATDDAIATLCKNLKVDCFRGSLPDVLDRFYQAATKYNAEHIVRLTGDCPLSDAEIIDKVITLHLSTQSDYTTNSILPDDPKNHITFPDGLDVEVITMQCLSKLWRDIKQESYREHVTSYVRLHPEKYTINYLHHPQDLSKHRWTVDEPQDFVLIKNIFKALYPVKPNFNCQDVVDYIERNPTLRQINNEFQHEKYRKQ